MGASFNGSLHMRPLSPLVIATALTLLRQAAAQETGDRVRVTLEPGASHALVGSLVAQTRDSLWVELPGRAAPLAVPRRTAARLEVSRGWDRETIRGAGVGAGLGAIAGAVLGGVTASQLQSCRTSRLIEVCSMEWYERAARGGLIGAALGGAIGAALGYAVKTERWGVSVAPLARGLELSVAF
jgi:hypothetical protein